jgi:hypothetical protein
MTLAEVGYLLEFTSSGEGGYAGSLTQGSVDDLAEWMETWE